MSRSSSKCIALHSAAALFTVALAGTLHAQALPDAGSLLQQLPPAPAAAPGPAPTTRIETERPVKLSGTGKVLVQDLRFSGNTAFDSATLRAVAGEVQGKTLSFDELQAMAGRITDYYHRHGYPLARAVIARQNMKDGVLEISVVEARYGKVMLANDSAVNSRLLEATLAPLHAGDVIRQAEMDRSLLLLSDLPGAKVEATLKAGERPGTSDMTVAVAPAPRVVGNITADNFGSRFTGRGRLGANFSVLGPLSHGDLFNFSLLSSGESFRYGRASYEAVVNGRGTRLGAAASALSYELGEPFATIGAHGQAHVLSAWARQPLLRSRQANVWGSLQYDGLNLKDRVDASAIRNDRHLDNITLALNGDLTNALVANSGNSWSLGLTRGRLDFDDAAARSTDAATARTDGSFAKLQGLVSHTQNLTRVDQLYAQLSGQRASANLDTSMKMSVGGPWTVRAYEPGAISGDNAWVLNLELRRFLGALAQTQWQAVAFVDAAHVTVNKSPWTASTNTGALRGYGLGLNWSGPERIDGRIFVAAPFGARPALLSSVSPVRGWAELSKRF